LSLRARAGPDPYCWCAISCLFILAWVVSRRNSAAIACRYQTWSNRNATLGGGAPPYLVSPQSAGYSETRLS
jgi:hypothetical protein